MQTYEIIVQNRSVRGNSTDMTLVRTSIGIDQVHVLFDNAEWLDFPITITFAQGDDMVTQALTVSEVTGSTEWVAEATVTVPYEVIDMVGPIRVTFQGTDSDGRHIITAKGSPLSVEEAGDVTIGEMPADVPTIDQWNQAYANSQAATNQVQSTLNEFQGRVDGILQDAEDDIRVIIGGYRDPATTQSLGLVQIGEGLSVTEDGVLSANATNGITGSQALQLANLAALAYYCFDTTFDTSGQLEDGAKLKGSALPVDGDTITVNEDGKLTLAFVNGDEVRY